MKLGLLEVACFEFVFRASRRTNVTLLQRDAACSAVKGAEPTTRRRLVRRTNNTTAACTSNQQHDGALYVKPTTRHHHDVVGSDVVGSELRREAMQHDGDPRERRRGDPSLVCEHDAHTTACRREYATATLAVFRLAVFRFASSSRETTTAFGPWSRTRASPSPPRADRAPSPRPRRCRTARARARRASRARGAARGFNGRREAEGREFVSRRVKSERAAAAAAADDDGSGGAAVARHSRGRSRRTSGGARTPKGAATLLGADATATARDGTHGTRATARDQPVPHRFTCRARRARPHPCALAPPPWPRRSPRRSGHRRRARARRARARPPSQAMPRTCRVERACAAVSHPRARARPL